MNENIRKEVLRALSLLYQEDRTLLEDDSSEWNITFRIAVYLESRFPEHSIDCEYNRRSNSDSEKLIKEIIPLPECPGSDRDGKQRIRPDILIHRRGTDSDNLLVVEVKKTNADDDGECDKAKLRKLTSGDSDFKYENGVFIVLPVESGYEQDRVKLEWFQNGIGNGHEWVSSNELLESKFTD